jgi:hypothetical protein
MFQPYFSTAALIAPVGRDLLPVKADLAAEFACPFQRLIGRKSRRISFLMIESVYNVCRK